jgi:hypothetical protein
MEVGRVVGHAAVTHGHVRTSNPRRRREPPRKPSIDFGRAPSRRRVYAVDASGCGEAIAARFSRWQPSPPRHGWSTVKEQRPALWHLRNGWCRRRGVSWTPGATGRYHSVTHRAVYSSSLQVVGVCLTSRQYPTAFISIIKGFLHNSRILHLQYSSLDVSNCFISQVTLWYQRLLLPSSEEWVTE